MMTPTSRSVTVLCAVLASVALSVACLRQSPTGTADETTTELSGQETRFLAVKGEVEYRQGEWGAWQKAKANDRLLPGAWVKTSDGSEARLRFPDGKTYLLRPNTLVHLASLLDNLPGSEAR